MILTGDNSSFINWFIHELANEFAMKDLGTLHYFLGVEVKHCELVYFYLNPSMQKTFSGEHKWMAVNL